MFDGDNVASLDKELANLNRHFPKMTIRSWQGNRLWANSGNKIEVSDDTGKTWQKVTSVPSRFYSRWLDSLPPVSRLLRLGIRAYLQIDDERFIVFQQGRIYYYRPHMSTPALIGSTRYGHGPLLQGCCKDETETYYYGEYWQNKLRKEVYIHHWQPDWDKWLPFYRFPAGTVRHIHAVQFDSFSKKVWVATGDRDHESFIGYFDGPMDAPVLVKAASGSQSARAVSLMFTPDFVYWGSDAGKDTSQVCNFIYRWSRSSGNVEQITPVGGPVYYSTVDDRGRLFVSTTVENSLSESDNLAHLWMSKDGLGWQMIASWKKDLYPLIFGYGVLSFPEGGARDGQIIVTGQGIEGSPGTWMLRV